MAIDTATTTTTVTRYSTAASLGLLLARIPIGAYFILAAVPKLRMGVEAWAASAMPLAPKFLSEHTNHVFLTSLPWAELTIGILVILGLLTRVAALVMSLLLISFSVALGVSGTLAESVKLPFHPNLVYLGTTLAIMLCGPGWLSLDGMLFRPRRRVAVVEEDVVNRRPNLEL
jgi:uncharacterized membrane protein YphA (DoxX/SURF4 family)